MPSRFRRRGHASFIENWGAILAITALAFLLRAIQTRSGLPYIHNWDEPQIASHAIQILKTGDWNPHFFSYGSLLIYIDTIVDALNYLRLAGLPTKYSESMMALDAPAMISRLTAPVDPSKGWYWTISHPSFYLWDRTVTAVFGALTVFSAFLLSAKIMPRRWAWLSAILLAILPIHVEHSAYVTSDAPVALLVVVVTYSAILFAERGNFSAILVSLVFVGLAAATKYNSFLIIVAPALALTIRSLTQEKPPSSWYWLLLVGIPPLAFLIAMPYALFDFKTFITDLALDITSYHAGGPPEATPGLRHIRMVIRQFGENLGFSSSLLALFGFAALARFVRRDWAPIFLLLYPVLFVAYMSSTSVDHHRNFIQLYPFIATFFAFGAFMAWRLASLIGSRLNRRLAQNVARGVSIALIAAAILPPAYASLSTAWTTLHTVETRTAAARTMARIADGRDIIVADELRMHPFDLSALARPYSLAPVDAMIAELCADKAPNRDFMLPARIEYTGFNPATEAQTAALGRLNATLQSLRGQPGVVSVGGDVAIPTFAPAVDPGVLLVTARPGLCGQTGGQAP